MTVSRRNINNNKPITFEKILPFKEQQKISNLYQMLHSMENDGKWFYKE